MKFTNFQRSEEIPVNVDSFKKEVIRLNKKCINGFKLEVTKKEGYFSYVICHERSPIPTNMGEIRLFKGKYITKEYKNGQHKPYRS